MKFIPLEPAFLGMPLWGAASKLFTFIISKNEGRFVASAKPAGAKRFDNSRVDLGDFASFSEAATACEEFRVKREASL